MRILESRQSSTSPLKYNIELTVEEFEKLRGPQSSQIINKVLELAKEPEPYVTNFVQGTTIITF